MFGILLIISIVGFFVGTFLCVSMMDFVPVLGAIGCYLALISLAFLIISSIYKENEPDSLLGKILTIGGGILLATSIFAFFCFMDIVPGMPQTESWRAIYGWLALGLMIGGGGSTVGGIIVIIVL